MASVKIKTIRKALDGQDVGVFKNFIGQFMGITDADVEILAPKYKTVTDVLLKICKVLELLATFKDFRKLYPELNSNIDQIDRFVSNLKQSLSLDKELSESKIYMIQKDVLNGLFKKVCEDTYVKKLIVTAGKLKSWDFYLKDEKKLDDSFIKSAVGLTLKPFDFTDLDLKYIWSQSKTTEMVKKFMLKLIHKLYIHSLDLYNCITSPNVDIDLMSQEIIEKLCAMRKSPELKGCDEAFKKIEKGVELLKTKFPEYHKSAVISNNPNVLFENFILDMCATETSPKVIRQLKKLINVMKTKQQAAASSTGFSPVTKGLFDLLTKQQDLLYKTVDKKEVPADAKTDTDEKNTESNTLTSVRKHISSVFGTMNGLSSNDTTIADDTSLADAHVSLVKDNGTLVGDNNDPSPDNSDTSNDVNQPTSHVPGNESFLFGCPIDFAQLNALAPALL
jgi:hypothetical protein